MSAHKKNNTSSNSNSKPSKKSERSLTKQFMLGTWFSFVSHFMPLSRVAQTDDVRYFCMLLQCRSLLILVLMSLLETEMSVFESRNSLFLCVKLFFLHSLGVKTFVGGGMRNGRWASAEIMKRLTKSFYIYTCLSAEIEQEENIKNGLFLSFFFVFIYFYKKRKNFYVFRRLSRCFSTLGLVFSLRIKISWCCDFKSIDGDRKRAWWCVGGEKDIINFYGILIATSHGVETIFSTFIAKWPAVQSNAMSNGVLLWRIWGWS